MIGRVKWFNDQKGFGFITPEGDHPEVFVHHSAIVGQSGRRSLVEFDRVEFRVVSGDRGPKAEDVRVISSDPESTRPTRPFRRSRFNGGDTH